MILSRIISGNRVDGIIFIQINKALDFQGINAKFLFYKNTPASMLANKLTEGTNEIQILFLFFFPS